MVFRNLTFSFLHKANLRQNAQNKFGFAPCFWTSSSPFGQALNQTPNSHPGTSRSLWCFQSEVLSRETVGERLFKKKNRSFKSWLKNDWLIHSSLDFPKQEAITIYLIIRVFERDPDNFSFSHFVGKLQFLDQQLVVLAQFTKNTLLCLVTSAFKKICW